jgi:hypothetical protein
MTILPDCMMPDGAVPCAGYRAQDQEIERLRAENWQLRKAISEIHNDLIIRFHTMAAEHLDTAFHEIRRHCRAALTHAANPPKSEVEP